MVPLDGLMLIEQIMERFMDMDGQEFYLEMKKLLKLKISCKKTMNVIIKINLKI